MANNAPRRNAVRRTKLAPVRVEEGHVEREPHAERVDRGATGQHERAGARRVVEEGEPEETAEERGGNQHSDPVFGGVVLEVAKAGGKHVPG